MDTKGILAEAANKIGKNVELEGLLKKTGRLKFKSVADAKDVLGFDYIVQWDDTCYEYYAANPPLIGMTQPVPVPCPLGIEVFNEYKIDYKKAVEIFHTGKWGERFTSIVLCKPLVHPEAKEPYWYFRSDLGIQVMIGADSGEVITPR